MDIQEIMDQIDEIVYISDLDTYELLYLNRYGCEYFGTPSPGTKCYKHLQGEDAPCKFCTNDRLRSSPDGRCTWHRKHPQIGNFTLHDCLIDYQGKIRRMELAFDVNHYIKELHTAKADLTAEKKLVACIEDLVMATDFDVAVNVMLKKLYTYTGETFAADEAAEIYSGKISSSSSSQKITFGSGKLAAGQKLIAVLSLSDGTSVNSVAKMVQAAPEKVKPTVQFVTKKVTAGMTKLYAAMTITRSARGTFELCCTSAGRKQDCWRP